MLPEKTILTKNVKKSLKKPLIFQVFFGTIKTSLSLKPLINLCVAKESSSLIILKINF
jgi:hypothetical protein